MAVQNQKFPLDNIQNAIFSDFNSCTISASNSGFTLKNSNNNDITAYNSNIEIDGGKNNNLTGTFNRFTVKNTNVTINGGSYNYIDAQSADNADHTIQFNNGTGINTINTYGGAICFGANGLTLNLNARQGSIFIAGEGNETLNGGSSTGTMYVTANNSQQNSRLAATTGSGDDFLSAGTGQSTFAGGTGNNIFAFDKSNDAGGYTVITDFFKSTGNKISLYNYGFNQNDVSNIIATGYDSVQNGQVCANLDLGNHQIQIENVSISTLSTTQFSLIS